MTSLTRSGRAFLRKSGGNPRGSQVCWVLKDCFHLGATVVARQNRRRFGPALDLLSCFTFQVELIPF